MTDVALQPTPEIPDKLYFKIGEVSELLGVEAYVLRYWETEFPVLSPKKSGTGHRLYDKRFTIEGARQSLHSEARAPKPVRAPKRIQAELFSDDPLPDIRRELREILELLK
jgi:hypothetical protein